METIDTKTVVVEEGAGGERLDKFLSTRLAEFSRSRIQALIEGGHITQAGVATLDASAKVKVGQRFHIIIPEATVSHMLPQEIALDVIFEDEHMLVINKQAGLTVHPAPGHPDNTLVNALLAHCGDTLSGIGGVSRPGIVHRIDKDTSGLLVVAKHDAAHNALSEQLATRTLTRIYQAVCWGAPKPASGTITGNIGRSFSNRQKMTVVKSGGKAATTHYKTLSFHSPLEGESKSANKMKRDSVGGKPSPYPLPKGEGLVSLIECKLETGRTHQIRVHMTHIGHPLVGDPVYGGSTEARLKSAAGKAMEAKARETLLQFKRQALHAHKLKLIHPTTNKEMEFTAPMPEDMRQLIESLEGNNT